MALREKRRLCKFVSEWTKRCEFSSWLVSVKEDKHKAYCLLCRKIFPVSHGGLHDVKTHAKSKRHICLQQQQENRATSSTGQVWPTLGVFHFLNPSNNKRDSNDRPIDVEVGKKEPREGETAEISCSPGRSRVKEEPGTEGESDTESSLPPGDSMHPIAMASPGKMETPQQYCLRWKYHHSNLQVMFSQLLERESFCDVTLACEGKMLRAHKMMLSACSTYFDSIFSQHEENNPIVILKDVKFADIKALVEFMYKGEINVENSHLSSLLKTAEELRIKGLAEVSWRSEGEGSWRSVEGGQRDGWRCVETQRDSWRNTEASQREDQRPWRNIESRESGWRTIDGGQEDIESDSEPPPPKKIKAPPPPPPPIQPIHTHHSGPPISVAVPVSVADHFKPKVTSVSGSVGSKDEFTEPTEPNPEPEVTMWEPEGEPDEYEDENEPPHTPSGGGGGGGGGSGSGGSSGGGGGSNSSSNGSSNGGGSSGSGPGGAFNIPSVVEEERSSFSESHLPDLSQYSDVVKMNDYLSSGGRRPQFWEEPFTKRVMEGIKNKELEMKVAAEILGVSYGTLYGRYRDAYGCLKHPYRVRDFWLEQGPAEVLAKLQRKELTLFRAAEMLNVTVTTLANYLSTLRQGDGVSSGGEEDEDSEGDRLASARQALSNNPDITIVKRERDLPSLNGNK